MFLNGTCVISLQFSRVEFTANHEFVPATFHCERKNKSSVILKPVSCVLFPISYTQNLPKETASCTLHILTGTTPIEANVDTQVLNLFIRILNLREAKEKDILQRQLALKDLDSLSWTQRVRKTLH